MNTLNEYDKQALKFLAKTSTLLLTEYVGYDYFFDDDKDKRDIYRITFKRDKKSFSIRFGQSITESKKGMPMDKCKLCYGDSFIKHMKHGKKEAPTAYDVLACITKNSPGTIDDFISDYGYDDHKVSKVIKTYNAVVEEWENVKSFWNEQELEELKEIQ